MSFLITSLFHNAISHIGTSPTVPAGQAPRGTYFDIEHYDNACWYVKNHYDDPDLVRGKSTVTVTDSLGELLHTMTLDHLVFRIKHSSASNNFVALTFTLKLYYYAPNSDVLAVREISESIPTRYHVQCVDLSQNGEFICYSNSNSIIRLERTLKPFETWTAPNSFDRTTRAASLDIRRALLVLGLNNEPSTDDIRSAFRKNLLKVHPDINKNDPDANDKTRAVVEAYEVLTRGNFDDQDTNNQTELGPIQVRFASEGDFITATQFGGGGEDLYIGCYSGKTYLLLANGNTRLIYNAHAPVRKIKELGRYLYIVSDHFWDILLNGTLLNRVDGRFRFDRILLDNACNAVLINHKTVRLYSHGGIPFAEG